MNGKITLDVKKKAVEMAIKGENPLPFLKKHGAKNPSASWQYIRHTLEKKDPETFAKLPDRLPKTAAEAMQGMKDAADEFFAKCEDMGLKLDTPAAPIVKLDGAITIQASDVGAVHVETPEGEYTKTAARPTKNSKAYPVTGIRTQFGEFYHDIKFNSIDWRAEGGEEIGMSPEKWKELICELPDIMNALGVEL